MSERWIFDRECEAPDPQAQLDQLAAENEELRAQLARQSRRRLWNTMYLMIGASLILDLHQSYIIQAVLNAATRALLP